jgi:hypothetical protein
MCRLQPTDRVELHSLGQKEVKLEMDLIGGKGILESQLIHSRRKLEALGDLCHSLVWLPSCLQIVAHGIMIALVHRFPT